MKAFFPILLIMIGSFILVSDLLLGNTTGGSLAFQLIVLSGIFTILAQYEKVSKQLSVLIKLKRLENSLEVEDD